MDQQTVALLVFGVGALVFLLVVYVFIKSPEKESRENRQEELHRQMTEFFERENQQHREPPS